MKKALIPILLTLLAAGTALGASLKIVAPNGGETLTLGTATTIEWSAMGINENVRLLLFKGGKRIGLIADNLNAAPSKYSWTCGQYSGGMAAADSDYQVRIRTLSDSHNDLSDGFFTLQAASSGSGLNLIGKIEVKKPAASLNPNFFAIHVTAPVAGGQYTAGQPLHIAWNKDIGVAGYIRMALLDDKGVELENKPNIPNTGAYDGWTPDSKYTWPGTKYRIRLTIKNPSNSMHAAGESELFSIMAPPPQQKVTRTLARNGETSTTHTREYQDEGMPECLSASHPAPGREPGAREIKIGQHVVSGRYKECDWYEAYYFQGHVRFDLDEIQGKEIVEAKLLVSLSGFQQLNPQGDLATNEECDSNCDVYVQNSNFPGILTSFSIFTEGEKKSLDVTEAVKHWAAGNPNNGLLFRSKLDHSKFANSVCLKYYATMFLTVKYIDFK